MNSISSDQLRVDATAWDIFARHQPFYHILSDASMLDPTPEAQHAFWEMGEQQMRLLSEFSGVVPTDGIGVDLGCGLGRLTRAMRPLTRRQIGIDISSAMIDRARIANREYDTTEFRQITGDNWPVEDGSADLVISLFVFQHMSSLELMESSIREMGRILRNGGKAVFQLPTITRRGALADTLRRIPGRLKGSESENRSRLEELRQKLRMAAAGESQEFSHDEIMSEMMSLECRRMKSLPLPRLRRVLERSSLKPYRLERRERGFWTLVAAERTGR